MRLLLASALVLSLTAPSAAQVADPIEPGLFGEFGLSGQTYEGTGQIVVSGGAVGFRLHNGVSLGLFAANGSVGLDHSAFTVGPEVRFARTLDARTRLDAYASAGLGAYRGPVLDDSAYHLTGLGTQVGASATRRYPLGRGLTFAATGGLFGGVGQRFAVEEVEAGLQARAGVLVGAQLEFDVLGATVGLGVRGGIPVLRAGGMLGFGADIHTAGGGPVGGTVSVRF